MPMKIEFNKEIHIFKGDLTNYNALSQYIEKTFADLPKNFEICYNDIDGDVITINSDEDLKVIASESSTLKFFVRESNISRIKTQPTAADSDSDDFEILDPSVTANKKKDEKKKEEIPAKPKRSSPNARSPKAVKSSKPITEAELKKMLKQQ